MILLHGRDITRMEGQVSLTSGCESNSVPLILLMIAISNARPWTTEHKWTAQVIFFTLLWRNNILEIIYILQSEVTLADEMYASTFG
jgi:hypothetical protein